VKITFDEVLSRNEPIQRELLNSLPLDIVEKAMDDGFYNIKILINGIEVEPKIFNDIMNRLEERIQSEAKSYVQNKLQEAENEAHKLQQMVKDVQFKIMETYQLDINEY